MGFRDYFATNYFPPSTNTQHHSAQEEHVAIVNEDLETTCWGCGVHLTVSPYAPAFMCSWCGAITNLNVHRSDNKYFWLRRVQDHCFVCVLFIFMLFMICGGIWAIYPVVFSISYFCGIFNCCVAIILSITTISMYFFAAFWPAGAPPIIPWGSYQVVGSGGLQNYTFCLYCSKPKSPRTHHCRSCGVCVLDMDHHCPFIGNCVGAANHRSFVLFLISAVTSTVYISIISSYAATKVWPPLNFETTLVNDLSRNDLVFGNLKEIVFALARSVLFLSTRGLLLCYLFIASLSVGIGLSVLLWQQLCFIYEGQTYLSHLKSQGGEGGGSDGIRQTDIRNLLLFFDLPLSTFRFLPSFWGLKKKLKK